MNIGGGEAADQLVRMMLSGSEVAVQSLLKMPYILPFLGIEM